MKTASPQTSRFVVLLFPLVAFGLLFLFTPNVIAQSNKKRKKPNVLFIALDDLNDWVGCYGGHPQVKTPNIDKLAKRGLLFTNAQCQAPVCNSSRASLITGLLPSTTGVYFLGPHFRDVPKTRNAESLFQYFQKQGYHTATRGKIFHGRLKPVDKASFDEVSIARAGGRYPKKKLNYPHNPKLWDWGPWYQRDSQVKDYLTAKWTAKRVKALAKKKKPFFMAVGFHLPHVPLYVPQKWFDLYPQKSLVMPQVPANDLDDISKYAIKLTHGSGAPRHNWVLKNKQSKNIVQAYLASISFVDHCVGITLDALEKSGEADNTIVVLWGDHGFHLGEKKRWAKRSLWEESARLPLIIAGLDCVKNKRCKRPVGLIDLYPTLIDVCGLPSKKNLEGVSLKPLLKNPEAKWDRMAVTTWGPNNHSIRSERWRYIHYDDGSEELYDHEKDPGEQTNLASLPRYAPIIKQHKQWMPKINVPLAPGSSGSGSPIYKKKKVR